MTIVINTFGRNCNKRETEDKFRRALELLTELWFQIELCYWQIKELHDNKEILENMSYNFRTVLRQGGL